MTVRILHGDCRDVLKTLPDESVHCVVTSPPYWGLRDYGVAGQLGLERRPEEYVEAMTEVFAEVHRVLRADGTVWLNLGDSYAGVGGLSVQTGKEFEHRFRGQEKVCRSARARPDGTLKTKDLVGIPWRVAFALQAFGWYLRQDIIWAKPNPMPESVTDRCTKAHEYVFLLAKSERYYYDGDAIREEGSDDSHGGATNQGGPKQEAIGQNHGGRLGIPAKRRSGNKVRTPGSARGIPDAPEGATTGVVASGVPWEGTDRNRRSVWTVVTAPFKEAHFATFPPALILPCILAGCPEGGTVLDPFGGAGTTGLVADRHHRSAILIELNPEYAAMAKRRIEGDAPLFAEVQ